MHRRSRQLEERLASIEVEREDLREREARFRILSELISDCCWARWGDPSDANHRIWVNDAFETLTGYTPEEFEAIDREGLVHPDDLEAALQHVDGPPGIHEHEFRIRRKDGQIRWLRERMQVEERGGTLLVLGATQDVTAQKEAEEVLRQGNRLLEERIRERTRELEAINQQLQAEIEVRQHTEEALRQARDAAQGASQAKSRFLANMSHEMRTPLNGVLGIAELLLHGELPSEVRNQMRVLASAAETLLELIDRVLDFSKIEAERLTLEAADFSLPRLLQQLQGVVGYRAAAKGLPLRFHLDPAVPERLQGDEVRLRQILVNLLDNAIKFTEEGAVDLSIEPLRQPGDDRLWLRFVVRDSGPGIAPGAAETLFQPFAQGDDSTARRFGGSGLGLAISRRLAELMGGEIQLESTPGEGSTFRLMLPFALPEESASKEHREEEAGSAASREGGFTALRPGYRVLVAEDNPVNQMVLSLQLEALGVTSQVAADGAAALKALETGTFDLVLMDCQMPEVDGYEATRRIRRAESPDHRLPIVGVTASAVREDLDRCYEVGMDQVLSKPYREEDLREALLRWLPEAPAGESGESSA